MIVVIPMDLRANGGALLIEETSMNSYDQISGGMTASAAVDRFFRRVLADPSLAPQFDGAQLHVLAAQQRAFLTAALGSAYQHTHGLPAVTAGPGTEAALA